MCPFAPILQTAARHVVAQKASMSGTHRTARPCAYMMVCMHTEKGCACVCRYDLDKVTASPVGLHGTLTVNMRRTPRKYASTFKSTVPARPSSASGSSAGALGPGSYAVDRSGVKVAPRASKCRTRDAREMDPCCCWSLPWSVVLLLSP